jgi:hypothetical protein
MVGPQSGEETIHIATVSPDTIQQYSDRPEELMRAAGLGVAQGQQVRLTPQSGLETGQTKRCYLVCICNPTFCGCFYYCLP